MLFGRILSKVAIVSLAEGAPASAKRRVGVSAK